MRICITFAVLTFFLVQGANEAMASDLIGPEKKGEEAKAPDYILEYTVWTGTSPGAGFTRTSLKVIELDLPRSRIRHFWRIASAPSPMLPYSKVKIDRMIATLPWEKLKGEEVSHLKSLIKGWVETNPPKEYNKFMALGHEDGYVEKLSVSWSEKEVTTNINPRRGWSQDDPLRPPREWQDLIQKLVTFTKPGSLKRIQ